MPTTSLPVTAAITDRLADWATTVVGDLGLPGIFVLMTLESASIPVPSEPTMLFAGFNVDEGTYSFLAVVSVAVAANVVGSWIAYAVGRFGRYELVHEHGKWLHITPERLAQADRWFERYGGAAVFFSRMLPIVRTFISLPAGVAKMPFGRFTLYTVLGCIPWMAGLTFIGMIVGENWEAWKEKLHYLDYLVLAVIVVGGIWLFLRWRRNRGNRADASAA